MNIKIRIVKDSKWLNGIVILFLAAIAVVLSHEMGRILHDSSALLPVFICVALIVVISKLLLDRKISLSAGYAEFNGQSIFIRSGSDIYVGNWDLLKKDDIVYNGDAVNLFCCTVGTKSTIQMAGEDGMSFQLHFPSKAHYVSIISFIDKLKLIEAHKALLVKHPDMYKYMTVLDKMPGVSGGLIPLLVEADPEPEKSLPLFPNYSFSPSVKNIPFH